MPLKLIRYLPHFFAAFLLNACIASLLIPYGPSPTPESRPPPQPRLMILPPEALR